MGRTRLQTSGSVRRGAFAAFLAAFVAVCMAAPSVEASTYSNATALDGPKYGAFVPYPSTINVTGVPGDVTKATVTVRGVGHLVGQDMDALLVAPNGAKSILFSDVCPSPDPTGVPFQGDFTFDDAAADDLLRSPNCSRGGTVRPTDFPNSPDILPAPAPQGPYGAAMSNFAGAPASGSWQLFVYDDEIPCGPGPGCGPFGGTPGHIRGGWSLTLLPDARCAGEPATVAAHVGTAAGDVLEGTPGDDVLLGLGGDDQIVGGAGHDVICGGQGKDTLRGEANRDKLKGGAGRDRLSGGTGKDRIGGGKGRDRCKGGKGDDKESSC